MANQAFDDGPEPEWGEGPFDAFLNTTLSVAPTNLSTAHLFDNASTTDRFYKETRRLAYNENSAASIEHYIIEKLRPTFELCRVDAKCRSCGSIYKPLDNIGRWQCRWHPGYIRADQTYSCCGRRNGLGCKRCDHSPILNAYQGRWPRRKRAVRVPRYLYRIIRWEPDSIDSAWENVDNPAHSFIGILRAEVERSPELSAQPVTVI